MDFRFIQIHEFYRPRFRFSFHGTTSHPTAILYIIIIFCQNVNRFGLFSSTYRCRRKMLSQNIHVSSVACSWRNRFYFETNSVWSQAKVRHHSNISVTNNTDSFRSQWAMCWTIKKMDTKTNIFRIEEDHRRNRNAVKQRTIGVGKWARDQEICEAVEAETKRFYI